MLLLRAGEPVDHTGARGGARNGERAADCLGDVPGLSVGQVVSSPEFERVGNDRLQGVGWRSWEWSTHHDALFFHTWGLQPCETPTRHWGAFRPLGLLRNRTISSKQTVRALLSHSDHDPLQFCPQSP